MGQKGQSRAAIGATCCECCAFAAIREKQGYLMDVRREALLSEALRRWQMEYKAIIVSSESSLGSRHF